MSAITIYGPQYITEPITVFHDMPKKIVLYIRHGVELRFLESRDTSETNVTRIFQNLYFC